MVDKAMTQITAIRKNLHRSLRIREVDAVGMELEEHRPEEVDSFDTYCLSMGLKPSPSGEPFRIL